MRIRDILSWSFKQIRKRILESLLIILGIALGIAVICSIIGLVEGFNAQTKITLDDSTMRTVTMAAVQDNYGMLDGDKPLTRIGKFGEKPIELTFNDYLKLKEANIEDVESIWVSENSGESQAKEEPEPDFQDWEAHRQWERDNVFRYCMTTPEMFQVAELVLVQGDFFTEADLLNKNKVIVLGEELAKRQFGDQNPIGQTIQLERGNLTVIGIVKTGIDPSKKPYFPSIGMTEDLDYYAYIPYLSYRLGYAEEERIHQINLMFREDVNILSAFNNLKNYIESQYGEKVGLSGHFQYQDQAKEQTFIIAKVIGIFGCAALLIAAINVLNLMMARVIRRYKNIGISAAVGASRRDVFLLFLSESLFLGILGSILGIGIAYGALQLLSSFIKLPLSISLFNWIISIVTALLVSLIFGLYPANQAAQVNPVNALRMD